MQALFNYRLLNLLGAAGCAGGLLMAIFYFQKTLGLEPCPMCIFQRVAMLATGGIFLLAALHGPKAGGRWVYTLLCLLASGIGAFIAGRHTWLQKLPEDQRPTCGPTLDYLIDIMPLREVVETVIRGDGNCAKIDWTLLGQSLPAWTLVAFAGFIAWAILVPLIARKPS
ncbi:MAG: disulfide bond formation protein B [Panacagrimonas sp.]